MTFARIFLIHEPLSLFYLFIQKEKKNNFLFQVQGQIRANPTTRQKQKR